MACQVEVLPLLVNKAFQPVSPHNALPIRGKKRRHGIIVKALMYHRLISIYLFHLGKLAKFLRCPAAKKHLAKAQVHLHILQLFRPRDNHQGFTAVFIRSSILQRVEGSMGSLVSIPVILELPAKLAHFLPHGFIQVAVIDRHISQGTDIRHPCLTG